MNPALAALDALQEVDRAIARIEREFRGLDNGAAEKADLERISIEHASAEEALHAIERDRRDAELELAAVEQKKRDHEQKLYSGTIRNPKELDAMQHEVEALGRNRSRLDGRILELMEQSEARASIVGELRAKLDSVRSAYEDKARVYAAETQRMRADMTRLQRLRKERVADVPAAALKRYEAIRAAKHGIGLARIIHDRCSACNTRLPRSTTIAVAESDALVTCDSCGRLLYRPPDNGDHHH